MPNFTVEELLAQMSQRDTIRSLSVIAHVDHGKSTLTDSLVARAGIIADQNAGEARHTDTRKDEQERGITIKSTGISMFFEYKKHGEDDEKGYLINLVDSPGHVDFSSEVTAALRITDGALVVVDAISGVSVQTETVLRQALSERVRPVLMLNKLDRVFLETKLPPEEAYQSFNKNIENINVLISTYGDPAVGNHTCDPRDGTVAFGAGLHGWGFTLTHFAEMYAARFGIPFEKMMTRLWGNNFFDAKAKKWRKRAQEGIQRAFCQFILDPIYRVFNACMGEDNTALDRMIPVFGIDLTPQERALTSKPLLKTVMRKWLNAADALLEMIVLHLPSPVVAQKYRAEHLYTGPHDDECYQAIANCDPNGPVMVYISKMIPSGDGSRFTCFGRVFSGTVRSGQRVRILGTDYNPEVSNKDHCDVKNVQRTCIMMGKINEAVSAIPCGNTCGLVGIDQVLKKTGTITTSDVAYPIKTMKFSVSPVVRVAVECKNTSDLPKLIAGLDRLSKSDPCVQITVSEGNEHIVAGAGELHIEICIKDLREDYAGVPLIVSEPVVSFRETIKGESERECLAKSANKHNRLHVIAKELPEEVVNALCDKKINLRLDPKTRAKFMADEYGYDVELGRGIFGFGPDSRGPNVIIDSTKGVQYLNETKETINAGFQLATRAGPLCEEPVQGVEWHLLDATFHGDAMHRGGSQVTPAARRVLCGSMICAEPTLLEPFYLAEITVPQGYISACYNVLMQRRAEILGEDPSGRGDLTKLSALIPVLESFGVDRALRQATSGYAFCQLVFDRWAKLNSNATEEGSKANELAMATRQRKEIGEIRGLSYWTDRM
ncbi:hypothetical protein PCE1_004518 [Barthelona sp. PCE]